MPTVFSTRLDGSEAVRFTHVSLVAFYLRQARVHAMSSGATQPSEQQFAESLLAVILAALCLEAFANEMGEETLPATELKDFLTSRRKYQKPEGFGSVAWKISNVFERKWSHTLTPQDQLMCDVESLFEMRNALVHYELGESAAKTYLPPPAQIASDETGSVMTVIDFTQQPTRIELPFVSQVTAEAAAQSYNTALRILKLWNEKAGAPPDALSAHRELSPGSFVMRTRV